jgi:biotin carboxylase
MAPYSSSSSSSSSPSGEIVVIVDPYSTGCLVAQEIHRRGYQLLCVWTDGFSEDMKTHVPMSCERLDYYNVVTENTERNLEKTKNAVMNAAQPLKIIACIAGGEAGVDLADKLSEVLQVRTNGTSIPNRRDKKVQQELIQQRGMRSVRQAAGDEFQQVEAFLRSEPYPIVLKPTESAGSDGVKLCHSYEEAKEHFHVLMESQMVNGGECPAVLCQEFLRGKEYVVDCVSRDGIHKTCMVRSCVCLNSRKSRERRVPGVFSLIIRLTLASLVDLPAASLAGLGLRQARRQWSSIRLLWLRPNRFQFTRSQHSHSLHSWRLGCPRIQERSLARRSHDDSGWAVSGGDELSRPRWRRQLASLCRALTGGYSQVEASADAILDEEAFRKLPSKPPSPFKAAGQEVILVSFSKGKVKSTPGYDVIRCLPSFVYLETGIKQGSMVDYTIDLFTGIGSVILMHQDEAILKKDMEFIRYMEEINGLFQYETKLEMLKRPRADSFALPTVPEAGGAVKEQHRHAFSADGPHLVRHFSNDRPELRGSLVRRMTTVDASKEIVVLVDPYSTGCLIAQEIYKRGYKIMALWTKGFSEEMKTHVPLSCEGLQYHAEVTEVGDSLADTAQAVYKAAGTFRVVACMAGGEAGVDMADKLSERLGVRSNGTEIPNRRDKKVQQELIKARGLRSVRQAAGDTFSQVEHFLRTEPYPVVLKPIESAGSDGVKLCHSFDEAKAHFDVLMKSQMVNGGSCPAVLCQEFLRGKEYVVDCVSRDGVHKT